MKSSEIGCLGNFVFELFQFSAPHLACFFAFGLHFAMGVDLRFKYAPGFFEQVLCVFLGFGYYFLFAALELCYFAFVSFDNLFKAFFLLVYFLAFLFPVTFVAYNVLQVFVALYVFCSSNFRSVGYHVFGYAYLARNLYCERTARLPDLQLKSACIFARS